MMMNRTNREYVSEDRDITYFTLICDRRALAIEHRIPLSYVSTRGL